MNVCRRARRQFLRVADAVTAEEWVVRHLESCPGCAAEAMRVRAEEQMLRSAAPSLAPPDPDRLWARIEPKLARRRRMPALLLAPLAPAALVVALWLARPLWQTGTPQAEATRPVAVARNDPPPRAAVPAVAPPRRVGPERSATPRPRGQRVSAQRVAPVRTRIRALRRRAAIAARRPAFRPRIAAAQHAPVAQTDGSARVAVGSPVAAPLRPTLPPGPTEAGSGALVVVVKTPDPPSGSDASLAAGAFTICSSETTDPVSGATTRLAVSRETDASGAASRVTIQYEVQRPDTNGVGGET